MWKFVQALRKFTWSTESKVPQILCVCVWGGGGGGGNEGVCVCTGARKLCYMCMYICHAVSRL